MIQKLQAIAIRLVIAILFLFSIGRYATLTVFAANASIPPMPTVDTRTDTTIHVNPNPGGPNNDTNTELAIYKIEGTAACNGTGGSYIAANGSDNGATAVWQTEAAWGTVTVTGLNIEKFYSFCVKARNADLVESGFSGSCQNNGGYIPLAGNFTVAASSGCTNRYVDGTNPSRYVCGVDNGSGNTNSAVMRLKEGTFTLLSTETFVAGSIVSTESGSLIIPSGAVIKVGSAMYAIDADLDGYPDNANMYVATTPPTNGRRKYLMSTLATVDCSSTDPTQNATCCIANGDACSSDGACCNSICGTDADGDLLFSVAAAHTGTCQATAYAYTDTNDSQACPTGADPAGACNKCVNGAITNQTSSEDVFSECAGLDCDGGVTKYYSGWSGNTCYYMLDVSAANHVCDGAGACKTAAVQCAASSQGVSTGVTRTTCKTMVGCSGTTAGSLGNVASGSDTYNECTATYNACSGNNRIGPDGNCNGAGACNTTGLSSACATRGTCQTGGGCSGGSCVAVTNQTSAQDLYNECTASYNACSGCNRIGPDGLCSGTGPSCKTTGQSSACAQASTCQTGGCCSAGSCVAVTNVTNWSEGLNCTAACKGCNAGVCTNIGNGIADSYGSNQCTGHSRCNGSGSCTTPTTTTCVTRQAGYDCSSYCSTFYISCQSGCGTTCVCGETCTAFPKCNCNTYVY